MQAPVMDLMQVQHGAYKYVNKKSVVPYNDITNFLDLCSRAITSFVNHLYEQEDGYNCGEMFIVVDNLIDSFHILFNDDDPVIFFQEKERFLHGVYPAFDSFMGHLSRCVEQPRPLKDFYLSLSLKVKEAFDLHIEGEGL